MLACLFPRRRSRSTSSIPSMDAAAKRAQGQGAGREAAPILVVKPRSPAANVRTPQPEAVKALPLPPPTTTTAKPKESSNGMMMAELDGMLSDRQRAGRNLVRVSSGNVMVYGNLGNIRGSDGSLENPTSQDVLDYLPKTAKELSMEAKARNESTAPAAANRRIGNIAKTPAKVTTKTTPVPAPASELCGALSRRMEPEELKEMGNEEYKKGRFTEALALYDRAIVMDPEKASYYSNKAAALTGMGRLLEAAGECKQAIRIDPAYYRAHHRLANLYLRLGEAEKAFHHFKQSGNEATANDISRAQALQSHISKSNEARKLKDYLTLLKESQSAAPSAADSSPQIFAFQAEAQLRLQRHEEADATWSGAPKFSIDECTQFFGPIKSSFFLMIQAQVDMAAGRFEDAAAAAVKAAQLDPTSREVGAVVRRTRAAAAARSRGNELFMASKFAEACSAYEEGLNHDAQNAVLLCNRAACRSKLGQYEKAIEDCSTALAVRPSYGKARRRRADCNAKLERWEASIKDYGVLLQQNPGDDSVSKALSEAQAKLKEATKVMMN